MLVGDTLALEHLQLNARAKAYVKSITKRENDAHAPYIRRDIK